MPAISTQQAQQELSQQYGPWKKGNSRVDNAPARASTITMRTAQTLRTQWVGSTNKWNQTMREGVRTADGITKWVSGSVSGGKGVVDFHAYWNGVTFLWHFRVQDDG